MTAVTITFELKEGKFDEFQTCWKNKVAKIEGTPGLGPILLLTKNNSNECISFVLWEKEDLAKNWEKSAEYNDFKSQIRNLVTEEPVREYFDISAASSSAVKMLKNVELRAA
jgi:heme-degrading monooxygenase HmoA